MDKTLIIGILLMIGAAQGLLLAAVLSSSSKGNKAANHILAILLFLFSFMLFFHAYSELQGEMVNKAGHEHFAQAIFSLFAPLIFYYVKALTQRLFVLRWKDLRHLLPLCIIVIISLGFTLFPVKLAWEKSFNLLMLCLLIIQMTIYLYLSLRLLQVHQQNIRSNFSALERINLRWLYFLVIGQIIIWPVAFLTEILGGDSRQWDLVWLLIAIFIYAIGYFSLRQPEIFDSRIEEFPYNSSLVKKKYEKSTLSLEDAEKISDRLNELMTQEKLYLNNDLSLPDLSTRLSVSTHHLSQILNERIGKSFFEFINGLRIEEAKSLLQDQKMAHLSIAGIAQEAVFNSLSAFNTIFKKYTGKTPSSYRKSSGDKQDTNQV